MGGVLPTLRFAKDGAPRSDWLIRNFQLRLGGSSEHPVDGSHGGAAGEDGELLGGGDADAFGEHLHATAGNAAEETVVDGDQDPHGGAAVAVDHGDKLLAGDVVLFGTDGEGGEHPALALRHGAAADELLEFFDGLAEFVHEVARDVDALAVYVFLDVAENVGELEGDAGLFGEGFGARIGVAEDADADEANNRSDEIAVAIEVLEGFVGLDSFAR